MLSSFISSFETVTVASAFKSLYDAVIVASPAPTPIILLLFIFTMFSSLDLNDIAFVEFDGVFKRLNSFSSPIFNV